MSTIVQPRREAASYVSTHAGAVGEMIVDTTNQRVTVHDGSTLGGFPQAAIGDLPGQNAIINGNFAINQRGYASGVALAAAAYAHDRWRDSGPGGAAYTFSQAAPDTQITITAGALTQAVDVSNVSASSMWLTWVGTSTPSIGQSGGSPQIGTKRQTNVGGIMVNAVLITGLAVGVILYVQFGTGTLGLVKLEAALPNAGPTRFERRHTELAICQRYYRFFPTSLGAWAANSATTFTMAGTWPDMRAAPTTTLVAAGSGVLDPNFGVYAISAVTATGTSAKATILTITTASATALHSGVLLGDVAISLSAEL